MTTVKETLDSGEVVDQIRRLNRLAAVPRWTVIPTIRTQSVAEHSFNVAWICEVLASFLDERCSEYQSLSMMDRYDLLWQAIIHDEAEAISGDIAAPFRRGSIGHGIKHYEKGCQRGHTTKPFIKKIVKIADCVEAWLFLTQEVEMGNRSILPIVQDVERTLEKHWLDIFRFNHLNEFMAYLKVNLHPDIHPCLENDHES